MKTRRDAFFILLIGAFFGFGMMLRGEDASARFPTVQQVTADYADDAERWGALNELHQALSKTAPKPLSKADYNLLFNYDAAYNAIENGLMSKGPLLQNQAYKDFSGKRDHLFSNTDFSRGLLEKYHLNAIIAMQPKIQTPRPTPVNQPNQPITSAPAQNKPIAQNAPAQTPALTPQQLKELQKLQKLFPQDKPARTFMDDSCPYPQSFVLMIILFVPVAFCTWVAVMIAGGRAKILPTPPPEPGGLPALPESPRIVSVRSVHYAVYVLSGLETQKESKTYTSSYTQTTPGQAVNMGGGNVHYTAPTSTTYTTTSREEIIWVRRPDGREQSLNFWESYFQSRPGQILSILVRPLGDQGGDNILVYNHTTGSMELCPAAKKAHGITGWLGREFVQWTGNLACGAASALITARYIPMFDRGSLYAGFLVWWFVGALMMVTVSFLVITPWITSRALKQRNKAIEKKYFPGLKEYFEKSTPILLRAFGRS